ncbi:HlyD family efflux transporter periplasmic adaptor subunit [Lachnospira multipara]|uniref:HlyD family efflux transporter periplasmic adaptor subunit n=1 Tax=Lachnospira multipara TaxID=28051 RepID=UPI000415DDEE|nr:HlyD family efflux transporter periplasmic adaptor subunit [Lachnospira multipara]
MKPIIVDMKDLSDSVEVYDSKPNPFLVYTIYAILLILIIANVWACFFKIDNVVKSSGIFKGEDTIYDISSAVSGKIVSANVKNGDYVNEGDVICEVSIESLSDTIINYQNSLQDAQERLEILEAYENSLDSNTAIETEYSDNKYYEEFVNRRALLLENISANNKSASSQSEISMGNIESISSAITQYEDKINKLNTAKACVTSRSNSFDSSESYYYSLVNSYISKYDYTKLQYDNTISELKTQLEEIEKQLVEIQNGTASESLMQEKSTIESQKESVNSKILLSQNEQTQALSQLEQAQISTIEQLIENYNDSLMTLKSNLETAKLEMNGIADDSTTSTISILTEKGNIASERLELDSKVYEYEKYLKSYNIQNDNCTITAPSSGYYYVSQDLHEGAYLQEGVSIGSIYPESESGFYAELYISNSDIGKIKEGQNVNFEISSFPSSEYGYFTGEIENISKTITVDENTGAAYYIVKVKCENMVISNKDGDVASLKNGMACTGKVIIGEKTVMKYLLEKINLLD